MSSFNGDLYARVTGEIIAALEAGVPPWVRPWDAVDDPIPINAITRRPYRGINNVLLQLTAGALGYERNSWLTYRQAREAGAQVRGGEEGVGIIFWQLRKIPVVGEAFPVQEDPDIEERVIPLIRAYTVFNVVQVDGLPRELTAVPPSVPPWQGQEIAERVVAESKADIRHTGFRAYYQPQGDFIAIPPHPYFQDAAGYYGTTLHELCHWTRHPKRLDRQLGRRWGESAYAMEELIAEIGAAFLCAHCRIEGRLQHANYLASWLQVLRSDTRAIFVAATKAQAAADWLLGLSDLKPASLPGESTTEEPSPPQPKAPVAPMPSAPAARASAAQLRYLTKLIEETGTEVSKLLDYYGATELHELTMTAASRAIKSLENRRAA